MMFEFDLGLTGFDLSLAGFENYTDTLTLIWFALKFYAKKV